MSLLIKSTNIIDSTNKEFITKEQMEQMNTSRTQWTYKEGDVMTLYRLKKIETSDGSKKKKRLIGYTLTITELKGQGENKTNTVTTVDISFEKNKNDDTELMIDGIRSLKELAANEKIKGERRFTFGQVFQLVKHGVFQTGNDHTRKHTTDAMHLIEFTTYENEAPFCEVLKNVIENDIVGTERLTDAVFSLEYARVFSKIVSVLAKHFKILNNKEEVKKVELEDKEKEDEMNSLYEDRAKVHKALFSFFEITCIYTDIVKAADYLDNRAPEDVNFPEFVVRCFNIEERNRVIELIMLGDEIKKNVNEYNVLETQRKEIKNEILTITSETWNYCGILYRNSKFPIDCAQIEEKAKLSLDKLREEQELIEQDLKNMIYVKNVSQLEKNLTLLTAPEARIVVKKGWKEVEGKNGKKRTQWVEVTTLDKVKQKKVDWCYIRRAIREKLRVQVEELEKRLEDLHDKTYGMIQEFNSKTPYEKTTGMKSLEQSCGKLKEEAERYLRIGAAMKEKLTNNAKIILDVLEQCCNDEVRNAYMNGTNIKQLMILCVILIENDNMIKEKEIEFGVVKKEVKKEVVEEINKEAKKEENTRIENFIANEIDRMEMSTTATQFRQIEKITEEVKVIEEEVKQIPEITEEIKVIPDTKETEVKQIPEVTEEIKVIDPLIEEDTNSSKKGKRRHRGIKKITSHGRKFRREQIGSTFENWRDFKERTSTKRIEHVQTVERKQTVEHEQTVETTDSDVIKTTVTRDATWADQIAAVVFEF